jgi:DnaJ-class molecular chaperone
MRDPYLILNVARGAAEAEIRGAYRRLVKRYHPDLNPDDHAALARFREIQQAYAILKDATQRARFDAGEIDAQGNPLFRSIKPDLRRAQKAPWREGLRTQEGKIRNADLLAEILSGLKRNASRGTADKEAERETLSLTFEEAALGARKVLALRAGGKLMVTVPPGVEDGAVLRLKGARDHDGKRREVQVKLAVAAHPVFRREGLHLTCELPITLGEAVLGGKVRVPTLEGAVMLTVPEGANTGTVLKLCGKGLQSGSARGDLLVTLKVVLPETPDPVLKAFVSDWQPAHAYDPRAKG